MASFSWPNRTNGALQRQASSDPSSTHGFDLSPSEAEEVLKGLANVFNHYQHPATARRVVYPPNVQGSHGSMTINSRILKPDTVRW
jgi:hypothetical protein